MVLLLPLFYCFFKTIFDLVFRLRDSGGRRICAGNRRIYGGEILPATLAVFPPPENKQCLSLITVLQGFDVLHLFLIDLVLVLGFVPDYQRRTVFAHIFLSLPPTTSVRSAVRRAVELAVMLTIRM